MDPTELIVIAPAAFVMVIPLPAVSVAGTGSKFVEPINSCPFVKGPKKLKSNEPSAIGIVCAEGLLTPVPPCEGGINEDTEGDTSSQTAIPAIPLSVQMKSSLSTVSQQS